MTPNLIQADSGTKTSAQAVWSLILGILSMACLWLLGSIPAIILGILAIKNIDRSGGSLKGRGLGIAGIVTGVVGIFAGVVFWGMAAGLALPAFTDIQGKALEAKQANHVRQVLFACRAYAADNNGEFPKDLPSLIPGGHFDTDTLLNWKPNSSSEESFPLLYRPGLSDTSPPDEPLIAAPQPIAGKRTVGYVDASVGSVPEAEFQSEIAGKFPQ